MCSCLSFWRASSEASHSENEQPDKHRYLLRHSFAAKAIHLGFSRQPDYSARDLNQVASTRMRTPELAPVTSGSLCIHSLRMESVRSPRG